MSFVAVLGTALNYFFFYTLCLYFLGLFLPFKSKIKKFLPNKKFLVIIPAHNEETVIADLIHNLHNADYPQCLLDINVIADNCTDNTANLVRRLQYPNVTVWERSNNNLRGKQHAIEWFLAQDLPDYDAMVVFDADNLAANNFFLSMNNRLNVGQKLVQCFIDAKNVNSWVAVSYSLQFLMMTRTMFRAKALLGSMYLGGTGAVISRQIIDRYGWHVTTLTDDLEYSVRMILADERIYLAPETRIYNEHPVGLVASFKQRVRWIRGATQTTFLYWPKLFKKAVTKPTFATLDAMVYIPFHFVMIISLILMLVYISWFGVFVNSLFLLFSFGLPLARMLADGFRFNRWNFLGILVQPIFIWTWYAVIVWAVLTCGRKDWNATKHFISVS
jgi:cellulose synthase/poly-beta-1,6-N-acetylglucosamine synthase-like glycosyltransferase